jgi:thioredoxin reductase
MIYDIIIIGAGPAGLSFARSLADTGLRIAQNNWPHRNLTDETSRSRTYPFVSSRNSVFGHDSNPTTGLQSRQPRFWTVHLPIA